MWTDYSQSDLDHVCSWDFYPLICDLILYVDGDIEKLQPNIKDNCLIFIKTDLVYHEKTSKHIWTRLLKIHQLTGKKFNLVIHCSDHVFPSKRFRIYDQDHISNIFANQIDARHEFVNTKVHPIGQGFFPNDSEILEKRKTRKAWGEKSNKLFLPPGNWDYGTNTIRHIVIPKIAKKYGDKKWFTGSVKSNHDGTDRIPRSEFLTLLDENKFSLCIPGNEGCQVNRFWESLAVDCVPVMIRECYLWKASMEELCSVHNLPCVWIDSIDEINIIETLFDYEYDFSNVEKTLMMEYWKGFIYDTVGK